jgi:hypothetical protein
MKETKIRTIVAASHNTCFNQEFLDLSIFKSIEEAANNSQESYVLSNAKFYRKNTKITISTCDDLSTITLKEDTLISANNQTVKVIRVKG